MQVLSKGRTRATTVDHDEIRQWVVTRRGKPAKVSDADGRKGEGILRNDLNASETRPTQIGWDEFFEI